MLRLLIQNISEIVVVIDLEGIIRFSSPQLEKVLGLRTEEVVGQIIFNYIHPDDVRRAALEYSETVQKPGEGVPSILRIRAASGEWIPLEIIANNQLGDPEIRGVIFTARDLRYRREIEKAIRLANDDVEKRVEERTTELAKANAALRLENQSRCETERRLQQTVSLLNATLDSTADGILVVGIDGNVSGCNRRFFEMWHLQCESATGRSDTDCYPMSSINCRNPMTSLRKCKRCMRIRARPASMSCCLRMGAFTSVTRSLSGWVIGPWAGSGVSVTQRKQGDWKKTCGSRRNSKPSESWLAVLHTISIIY